MSDDVAFIAGTNSESPKQTGLVDVVGATVIGYEPNKNEHITSEMQNDENGLYMHHLSPEKRKELVTNTEMADPNYLQHPVSLSENHIKLKNESLISDGPLNEKYKSEDPLNGEDNCSVEAEELCQSGQDEMFSINKFEQFTDEGDGSDNSSLHSIDTVVYLDKQDNASKHENRFIEPNMDKCPDVTTDECSHQNDRKIEDIGIQNVSKSFDQINSLPSQQENNVHQINVSPVQNTERVNMKHVQEDTIDSELAELAKV